VLLYKTSWWSKFCRIKASRGFW